jgi:hypothetical protein
VLRLRHITPLSTGLVRTIREVYLEDIEPGVPIDSTCTSASKSRLTFLCHVR